MSTQAQSLLKSAPSLKSGEVVYEGDGRVATITLTAAHRGNTISGPMLDDIVRALVHANEDEAVRCVILTGSGSVFCAGSDLRVDTEASKNLLKTAASPTSIDLRNTPPTVLQAMDKPVICALNGGAAGYGLDTALGCDIRIAAETAKLAPAFCKRGVLPESGATWYLPRLIGWAKAAELIFTGRTLSAHESLEWGLVSRVVKNEELMPTARALANEIAANAPLAVQAAKRMMRMGLNEPFPEHVHHLYLQLLPLLASTDAAEGMAAFVAKRTPVFEGR